MSDRPIDINASSSTATNLTNSGPSEAEKLDYKNKLAVVLERGLIIDMLQVKVPDDVHGEWVAKGDEFVTRLQILGYKIDTEYAPKKSLNDKGDGTANLGDVVFMTIPKWKKEMIDAVARQRYYDTHIRDRRKQKEETDFENLNRGLNMPTKAASSTEGVSGTQIEETIKKE